MDRIASRMIRRQGIAWGVEREREIFPLTCENDEIQICHFTDYVEVAVNEYDTGLLGQLVSWHLSISSRSIYLASWCLRVEKLDAVLRVIFLSLSDCRR